MRMALSSRSRSQTHPPNVKPSGTLPFDLVENAGGRSLVALAKCRPVEDVEPVVQPASMKRSQTPNGLGEKSHTTSEMKSSLGTSAF